MLRVSFVYFLQVLHLLKSANTKTVSFACLLRLFTARRTVDRLSTDWCPVGISRFIPGLLGCPPIDVAGKPMPVDCWVMCVRNRRDDVPGDVVSRPFAPESDSIVPASSAWRAGIYSIK